MTIAILVVIYLLGWVVTLYVADRNYQPDGLQWYTGPLFLVIWPVYAGVGLCNWYRNWQAGRSVK